jgi:excisionase family DNA binding protein
MSKINGKGVDGDAGGPRLLSIVQAACELGICRTLVYALIKEKKLRSITIGRRRLIPAEAIDVFIAELNKGGGR